MFGCPEWFREKRIGWGLTPVTWQGWLYTLVWCGLIAAPFVLLTASGRVPEALVWMGVSVGTLVWDVRQVLASLRGRAAGERSHVDEDRAG